MYDAIVIGSGFAGLVAARTIARANKKVVLLEAQSRLGGRCYTSKDSFPAPVDLGCSWIHGYAEGTPVRDLVEELGIKATVPQKARSMVISQGKPLNPEIVSKLQSNQSKALEKASKSTGTGSLGAFLFSEHDAAGLFTSLSDEERRQVEGLTRTLEVGMGASLERFSLRWNGYEDSFKGTDAGPEGGYSRVIDALAESFTALGGEIRRDTPVLGLNPASSGEGIDVRTSTGNAASDDLSARLVICTIPLAVLQKSHKDLFHAPLSSKKVEAIEKTHVGQLGKIVLSYDQAWWPTDVGAFTILPTASPVSKEEAPPKDARALLDSVSLVTASFAVESSPTSHPTLLTYLPAPVAVQLESMPLAHVTEAIHSLFLDNLPRAAGVGTEQPIVSELTSWSKDSYALGATSTPVIDADEVTPLNFVELGKPEWQGRLLFAGEHTSLNNRGSVTGAVETGEKEGKRAVRLLNAQT